MSSVSRVALQSKCPEACGAVFLFPHLQLRMQWLLEQPRQTVQFLNGSVWETILRELTVCEIAHCEARVQTLKWLDVGWMRSWEEGKMKCCRAVCTLR